MLTGIHSSAWVHVARAIPSHEEARMKEVSRRGFITRASVVGVGAAAAVTGIASLPTAADAAESKTAPDSDRKIDGPAPQDVVVHIRDAKTSEVALIAGTEEYIFHDKQLVSSVLRKFNKSAKE
jgi:hypothetical protein